MKQIYLTLAYLIFAGTVSAQTFDYSLSFLGTTDDGTKYEVALLATPDFTETDGNSADIQAVVSMSSNVFPGNFVNECVNSGPPNFETICEYPIEKEEWASIFLSGPSAAAGRSVFSFERTESGVSTFFDAVSGEPIVLAVFEINNTAAGLPTTGDIVLVENGDSILDGTPNGSSLSIKYLTATNDITTDLYGEIDQTQNSIDFSTLSVSNQELVGVSMYPNPIKNSFTIKGVQDLQSVAVYNINGQRVLNKTQNLETIDVSTLQAGVYFAKVQAKSGTATLKIIKE